MDAPPPSASAALFSETSAVGIPPALSAHERSQQLWMAPSGRLRIGSSGVPVKFRLDKAAAPSRVVASPARARVGDGTALGLSASEEGAASSDALSATGGGMDRILSHHLQLLVGLVGQEAVMSLDVGHLFPKPGRLTRSGGGGADTAHGAAHAATTTEDADADTASVMASRRDGLALLRLDESRLPLWAFDVADDEEGERLSNGASAASALIGRTGIAPYYGQSGWEWAPAVVRGEAQARMGDAVAAAATVGRARAAGATASSSSSSAGGGAGGDALQLLAPSRAVTGSTLTVEFTSGRGLGRRKDVSRLDFCLDGEDRFALGGRIARAMRRRESTKAGLRFQHLIDTLQLPQDIPPIGDAWLARIYTASLSARRAFSSRAADAAVRAALWLDPRAAEEEEERAAAAAAATARAVAAAGGASRRVGAGGSKRQAKQQALGGAGARATASGPPGLAGSAVVTSSSSEEDNDGGRGGISGAARRCVGVPLDEISDITGLPRNATTAQLLAQAACDTSVSPLFAEVCFEFEFAVKASVAHELVTRAAAAAEAARAIGAPPGTARLGSTVGLKASPALEAFARSLASQHHRLRLPDPPVRPRAPAFGRLTWQQAGYASADVFAPARDRTAHAPALAHTKTARALRAAADMWASSSCGTLGPNVTFIETTLASLPTPCKLKAYVAYQAAHVKALSERLSNTWGRDIAHALLDGLPSDVYHLYEQDMAAYMGSPLHRLLVRVEAGMTAQLRQLLLNSIRALRDFFVSFAPDERYDKPVAGGWIPSYKRPLFVVELELKRVSEKDIAMELANADGLSDPNAPLPPFMEVGVGNYAVQLSPGRGDVHKALMGTLSAASNAVGAVCGIQRSVMALLRLPDTRLLLPGTNDPLARDVDDALAETKFVIRGLLASTLLKGPGLLTRKFHTLAWLSDCTDVPAVVAAAMERAIAASRAKMEAAAAALASSKPRGSEDDMPPPASKALDDDDGAYVAPVIPDAESLFSDVARFAAAAEFAQHAAGDVEDCGLLRIRTGALKASLISRALACRDGILNAIVSVTKTEAHSITANYVAIIERLEMRPSNESELLAAKAYLVESEILGAQLGAATASIHARVDRFKPYAFCCPEDEFLLFWSLKEWPQRMAMTIREMREALDGDRTAMIAALEAAKITFERDLELLESKVAAFKDVGAGATGTDAASMSELNRIVSRANDIDNELRSAAERSEDINTREKAFGFAPTAYVNLRNTAEGYEPFMRLWLALSDFMSKKDLWLTSSLLELNASDIERDVTDWWTMSYRLQKSLGDAYPGANGAAKALRASTDEFRKNIPIIRCLASHALESRHWVAISEHIGRDCNPKEEDITMGELLAQGVLSKFECIEEVAVQAEKEFNLKKALDAMKRDWDGMVFECVPYKATGTCLIRGTDDINQLLDDQIVKTQTMLGSPYMKPNLDECTRWEKLLVTVQQVTEEWLAVQRTWLYLEPIFSSEDIMRQMPQEGRRFASVDRIFRATMTATVEEPKVLIAAGRDKMLEKMREASKLLDAIQKGLNDYLEIKRLAFPRFFFLSNDELLEILSQTKDPRAAQPHLGKCFEGIFKVGFRGEMPGGTNNPEDVVIMQMISAENEIVPLNPPVDPNAPKAKGNVEVWFTDLQRAMRLTVKDVVKQSILSYPKTPRKQWVLDWPGQVALNVSQLFWTQEVEAGLLTGGLEGLRKYEAQLNVQLQDIVSLVRGKLSKMGRTTLSALTVIDVHARDVVSQMVEKGVSRPSDFEWMAQMRYYWQHAPDDYARYGDDPMNLVAKIVNASQGYSYEYLGNSSRLVITPLTDRCYRTLMSAVYLTYGGAPAGPAGTGKTETVKDLAKAMAIQCVVFNCSDGLDYLAMGKFFKGLAASGAWACFDEFNRIELEVLSVVAQQVLTVQKAKRARVAKFMFEGTMLPLNPDANAFITMNPGYAGRSELPDNLKALFRPVSMMVPDYALISEIKLYSFGFGDARNMARKLTQVLKLSSEQLSSQKHYDYGMRAVFSILVRAGNLRQALGDDPAWTEEKIVLSAVLDVNVPKFTTNDLPLFKGITSDLFPGVELPKPDYALLLSAIKASCRLANLQPKDEFVQSVVQLYETVQVRHGLMVVGETGCAKTKVLRILADAMGSIKDHPDFVEVRVHTMNPKAVTQGQLYGNFDENTHEWTDGILAILYRTCARDTGPERQWLVFDGPVDAVWIESMNTVLDDNKKLCLNSGEIIKMSPAMTMMYETDSLAEASPATVSRCGMVYMEPKRLGWRPLLQSWLNTLPRAIEASPPARELIVTLFEWLVPPLLAFTSHFVKQLTPVTDLHLVSSLISMYDCLLEKPFGRRVVTTRAERVDGSLPSAAADEKAEREVYGKSPDAPKMLPDVLKTLEGLFLQCLVWTIGAVTDAPGRIAFSSYLRLVLSGKVESDPRWKDFKSKAPLYDAHYTAGGFSATAGEGDVRTFDFDDAGGDAAHSARQETADHAGAAAAGILTTSASRFFSKPLVEGELRSISTSFPEEESVYDWVFSLAPGGKGGVWKSWLAGIPAYKVPDDATYTSIIVPTIDTVRSSSLLDLLITHGKHVLCCGETGTGKTVTLREKLMGGLPRDIYSPVFLNFSAQTSANQTQSIIDAKMSRRRKGVFGPPLGSRFVVFVDDLNLPSKEKYGAQPPIEILRQWMDHGGWYDRTDKDQAFMELVDIQFVAAMGPPGGGRTRISQRYVRHFNVLSFVPFDNASLGKVFTTILAWSAGRFSSAIKAVVPSVVAATQDMYSAITREMLPTPAKSHYTFNLRDLSKVFQGMNQAAPGKTTDAVGYFRLWAHECQRVFYDRLTTEADRKWFMTALADRIKEHFRKDWVKDIRGSHETLIYGNFMDAKNADYEEVADRAKLATSMATFLDDYNAMSASQLTLVLFGYAVEHVARISRIINQPGGNALLAGVGGSGRKSLCVLAAFMAGYKVFSVEITKSYGMTEWRDDLKRVLQQAGKDGKDTVFLFSDTQIVKEAFVEDISNILNNGEVPNLFAPDERAIIVSDVQAAAKKEDRVLNTATEAYAYFIERVKAKLHTVLCFSPIGDAFRTRLRMFPSLVNCCTIDWFTPWPEEGLRSVALAKLDGVELPGSNADAVKEGVIDVCVDMQVKVTALSSRFLSELKRYYYVTPTSYLELISSFRSLIAAKSKEILTAKARYANGLEKIISTEAMVDGMQAELIALQPQLKVASEETDVMIARIEVVSTEANAKAVIVAQEEAVCGKQAAEAKAMKEDCEAQLAEAIPILEAAKRAVANLSKSDINEMKSMKVPNNGVKVTAEALCQVFGVTPKKVPNPAGKGPKVDDYWDPAKGPDLLGGGDFMNRLTNFDANDVKPEVITALAPYIAREDFAVDVVTTKSVAAGGLARWVHAIYSYDKVARIVAPKKEALKAATAELAAAQEMLSGKQAELAALKAKLASLEAELAVAVERKNKLSADVQTCASRLDRAQRLIGGLGGEKTRWGAAATTLQATYDNIVGDVLLSAGMIAYLGAFTAGYREEALTGWSALLQTKGIPCASRFSLGACLGDPVQVRAWTIAKLPNDSFSIDNAIMLYNSARWPLCIDPQRQANKWIRNMEAKRNIKVVKQSQSTFVRTIEAAIQFGTPVLLENVPEALDPVLEPLLARAIVRVGGVPTIRLGDATVEFDAAFRLYICTVLPNPHYPPETCVKVNLLNFMATSEGLQDQMLGIVVKTERPDLEEQREKLILEDADNKRQLKELEDKILALLAASKGNILDDEVLISTLGESKTTSNAIMRQVEVAERTQVKITAARAGYTPIAKRASLLFFCIADLAAVDPMYQYSLEWYIKLFLLAIEKAPPPEDVGGGGASTAAAAAALEKRIASLLATFSLFLYENVCRSLFGKDKLLFSFLLASKIMVGDGRLDADELRFFLQGSLSMALKKPVPPAAKGWLSEKAWGDLLELALLPAPAFKDLDTRIESNLPAWEKVFESSDPIARIGALLGDAALPFHRLCVLRCLRQDKVVPAVQAFIASELGSQFIDPPSANLQGCFDDSDTVTPLVFVLSVGADPMSELLKLADRLGKSKKLVTVSLGQGQGPIAERLIAEAIDAGSWVCLQNCHLAESWMPTLERIVEEIRPEATHEDFRLWLTAMPSPRFPVLVLQNGIKMTVEPPKGMRANLAGSFSSLDPEWFEGSARPALFKKLVYGLAFFHANALERRKYGPLGWNIRYDFADSDLRISLDQLKLFIDDPAFAGADGKDVPFEALTYLTGECNYGGRVTDAMDRCTLMNILSDVYTENVVRVPGHKLSPSGKYFIPDDMDLAGYSEFIKTLPFVQGPELFGLNENADITCAVQETIALLSTALALQPRGGAGGSSGGGGGGGGGSNSFETTLATLVGDISAKVPELYDIEAVAVKFPVSFEESTNTVLVQECMRFNTLTGTVKRTLREVGLATKGLTVMSGELEALGVSMVQGRVPDMWKAVAYPSVKPLGSWVADLLERLAFLQNWIDTGKAPHVFWLSGFFFTQSFLTGVRQNFARRHTIAIDLLSYSYRVLTAAQSAEAKETPPVDGVVVHGLFFQGASWDAAAGVIAEARPRELFALLPYVHLLPVKSADIDVGAHEYQCPVYKTSERAGLLSTTGHSTNFVGAWALPMRPSDSSKHWVKRGAALFTSLDD